MLYENRRVLSQGLRVADALVLPAAAAAVDVWILGPAGPGRALLGIYAGTLFLSFLAAGCHVRLYNTWRTETIGRELCALLLCSLFAVGMGSFAEGLAAERLGARGLSGTGQAAIASLGCAVLLASRLALRAALRRFRRAGRNFRTWLLVGWNRRAARIAEAVLANPHFGIRIVAILDARHPSSDGRGGRDGPASDHLPNRLPLVHGLERLREILAGRVVDEVVLTLPMRTYYEEGREVLRTCTEAGVSVKLLPDPFELSSGKTELGYLGSLPLVTHYTGPSEGLGLEIKRLLDLVGATVSLVALSPLIGAIAFLIRATSGRPVFFRQTRVGLHGRRFQLLKFRTMVPGAESLREGLQARSEVTGPVFKMREDPRVTPIGRFLRRYHLDELPQLWNILRGEMSLVGPRPPIPQEVARYDWWQRRRLSMPPGLTCLWQVNGRHNIPFSRWMELDLEYIDRWSLALDVRLLVRTIPAVLRGGGW